jgi:hypothetical protein
MLQKKLHGFHGFHGFFKAPHKAFEPMEFVRFLYFGWNYQGEG